MPNPGTLYVFLHGLFVVKRGNQPLVVLPRVSGHVYKAGNWLAETPITASEELELLGVNQGDITFSSGDTNFMIHLSGTILTSSKRAATIVAHRPKQILGLLRVKDSEYVAKEKPPSNADPWTDVATVQVLVYDYADENKVALKHHYWEPRPTGGAISLHIISTSEELEGQEHENKTEKVMKRVLENYPGLEFQKDPRPLPTLWVDWQKLAGELEAPYDVQGQYVVKNNNELGTTKLAFNQAELEHPTSRLARLGLLGGLKRGKLPIEGVWHFPDPLSERVSNCVTVTTD